MIICITIICLTVLLGIGILIKSTYEKSILHRKLKNAVLDKYDAILCCKKLFITEHYNKSEEMCIIDLDDYIKKDIIHLNRFHTGPGDNDSLTQLISPAAVYKVKGENIWEYLEL